jgi:outer membrane protein OmpA-like peptidoglycan-associated protein
VDLKYDPDQHSQTFIMQPGQEYRLIGEKPGYLSDSLAFNTHDWNQPLPLVKDLFLKQRDVLLDVFTFDELSRLPLEASSVRLYDVTEPGKPRLIDEATNTKGNDFHFKLRPNRRYEIRGSADGYMEALDKLDTYTIPPDNRLKRDLYLRYKTLEEYLPLAVFFDNDVPGRRQRTPTTRISYGETFEPYLERENEYADIFSSVLTEQEQSLVRGEIRDFFNNDVRKGLRELNNFCEALLRDLQRGNSVSVTIEGYTSPRAAEYYNQKLGGRRASSVQNYIESWQDGAFKPFLKTGQLRFEPISWGETKVRPGVSDDIDDERLSIYAVDAARERRAEINDVKVIPKK